jgi:hypothetical protein
MMTRTTKIISGCTALAIAGLVSGCATTKQAAGPVVEKDVSRVIKLGDGATCIEPAGLAETRRSPVAVQLKELFESDAKADEALTKVKEFKFTREEVEAVYFDACRAYSNTEITKAAFEKDRNIYLGMRQQLFAQGVKQWQDKKDGIADPGKLCLVTLPDTDPDHRSFTRVIPEDSAVNDCAQLAVTNGGSEILLGCTKGHWENVWAKSPIAIGPAGAKTRDLSVRGTSHAPDPDCGWN